MQRRRSYATQNENFWQKHSKIGDWKELMCTIQHIEFEILNHQKLINTVRRKQPYISIFLAVLGIWYFKSFSKVLFLVSGCYNTVCSSLKNCKWSNNITVRAKFLCIQGFCAFRKKKFLLRFFSKTFDKSEEY